MTREAGWRYGIISTVPNEQQKIYRKIILFQRIYYLSISLTGLPCHREPSIVLMSMLRNAIIEIVLKDAVAQRSRMSPAVIRRSRISSNIGPAPYSID